MAIKYDKILGALREEDTGGTGGAVDSVNGATGVVVLDQDDIGDGTTNKQFTATEKTKLSGIATGAEANVNADWNAVSGDAQILNKPTIPSAYTLPTADASTLGGIKVGSRLTITAGVLSADVQTTDISGKENVGVAAGLLSGHTTTYDHSLLHAPGSDNQDLSGLVPYTGATGDVDLGTSRKLTAGVVHGNNSTSGSPGIIVEGSRANMLYKTTGVTGGVAFNIIKATVANTDPAEAQWGVVGFYGSANLGGDPIPSYMYFDARPTGAYNIAMLRVGQDGVGIGLSGTTDPTARLEVNQIYSSAALPTLTLSQADLSEELIRFNGTVAATNPISTAAAGTYYGKVRVSVNGTAKWIHLFN